MSDVPSNLIPTRITQLPVAPTASRDSIIMIVYEGSNYLIRVGDLLDLAGGTVQSVSGSGGSTGMTLTGGPITVNGTLTMGGTLNVASGGTGANTPSQARSNLSAAVSGANNDITSMTSVTGGISTPDFIDFDTVNTPASAVGRMYWNNTYGAPTVGMIGGNVQGDLGLQMFAYVTNAQGSTISKGQPVYLHEATGNRANVRLAFNTSDATSAKTFGLAAENITAGSTGYIITQGVLSGINTSAFNEGDTLYLGATAGTLTSTKPSAPNHLVYVGIVERANAGNGQIYVRPQNGYELDEIHDVAVLNPTNGQTITYNSTTSLWEKTDQSALSVGRATNLAGGAIGSIPYQSALNTTALLAAGAAGSVLQANGAAAPSFVTQASLAVGQATNLAGGAASQIPYQTGANTTTFLANGTAGQVLRSAGASAPAWANIDGGTF